MPDSAEQLIINRLATAPSIHPSGANLFVQDWTLEPGDVVTVLSGEENYQVPIYSMNLKWNGASMLDIQSTGNQKRNPLSALNEKKTNEFRSGRRGLAAQQEAEEKGRQQYEYYTEQTDAYRKEIYTVSGVTFDNDGNIIYQKDDQGNYILDNAGNKIPVYNENSNGSISGQVIQSAQRMATIIKQTGAVLEVFDKTHQYYEGDRVLYPDSNGDVYRFITDHNPGDWKGTGEHGDVEALGTFQSQIDQNTTGVLNAVGYVQRVDGRVQTIEGSTIWNSETDIVNILGSVSVDTTSGKVIINNGYGLYTNDGGTQYGYFNENNLDAGVIVNIINGDTTQTTIKSDMINLEGYVTASYVDATILKVDNLTSTSGYSGSIAVSTSVTAGSVIADSYYFKDPLGTSNEELHTRPIQLLESGYLSNISAVAIGTAQTLNLTHYHDIDIEEVTTGANAGKMKVTIGHAVATSDTSNHIDYFKIADTTAYKNGVASAQNSIELYDYTWHVSSSDSETAEHGKIYSVTLQNTRLGYQSGTQDDQLVYTQTRLYNSIGPEYITEVYNAGWEAGSQEGSGGYETGYEDGQDNAFASIKSIEIDEGSASYASSNLSVNITAVPQLSLIKQDETTTQSDGESETVAQTLPVAVTDVTISDSSIVYNNNRTYTIGGSGGNVNIGAVSGVGGANIPVDTNAYPFTPTEALNDVNVVKGNWTGTTTKTIEFTTDAPSPVAGSSKSVSLTLNKGTWTWETEGGGGGNYKTQVQVKDGSAGILTDYVTLPDLSVDVDKPQQQDSWWNTSGTYAYQYVVPQIGAVPYLSSDTSKQNPLGYYHNDGTIVINPSQAIEHGKSLVSVTRTWTEYDGTPSGDTPLSPGKTYHLEVKKDSTTVYDELYTVPEEAAPTVGDWQLNYQGGTNYTYKTKVKVNGTWYESENLSAANAYDNGWTGAYGEIDISPSTVSPLNPGGSATIYAQGKSASGAQKANVPGKSVTVTARALNLKDETFTANDTYAVPEGYDGYGAVTVNVQGSGSSDRRAVFLDNITLTAPENPQPGFNWQFTESSFAHYTDPVSVETDETKKTQVTIDASAIYQAGLDAGGGGGGPVDVIKGDWEITTGTQSATCEFSTNTGGASQNVLLSQSADSPQTDIGRLSILDGSSHISTAYFLLQRENDKVVMKYAPFSYTNDIISMASIKISLGRRGQTIASYTVGSSEAPIIESDVDDVVKNPTQNVTYSENYKTAYIPVQALDENDNELLSKVISVSVEGAWNDGHTKGVEEGSGIKIEQEKEVTASQNNTTITVLPTYTADQQYDVMGSVKVKVQVPTYEGISSAIINAQEETEQTWWRKELGKGTLSNQYGQIKVTGVDGSEKYYIVDASQVYQNGVNAGAGGFSGFSYAGTAIGNVQEDHENGEIKVNAMSGSTVLATDTLGVYLVQGSWNSSNRKAVNIRMSDGSNTLIARTWVDAPTAPSSHNITAGSPVARIGNTGSRVYMGSINLSSLSTNSWISVPISCGDASKTFYIEIN